MSIDKTILRLWVEREIRKVNYQLELGTVLPAVGRSKIQLLQSLTNEFSLVKEPDEEITFQIGY